MTSAELFAVALARLDQAALQVGLSSALGEDERHLILGHLTATFAALCTHQALYATSIPATTQKAVR